MDVGGFYERILFRKFGCVHRYDFPTHCYVNVHKGEVLYVMISQIITDSYVICFNHMVFVDRLCVDWYCSQRLLKLTRIIFIATVLNVFADGPE